MGSFGKNIENQVRENGSKERKLRKNIRDRGKIMSDIIWETIMGELQEERGKMKIKDTANLPLMD